MAKGTMITVEAHVMVTIENKILSRQQDLFLFHSKAKFSYKGDKITEEQIIQLIHFLERSHIFVIMAMNDGLTLSYYLIDNATNINDGTILSTTYSLLSQKLIFTHHW